MPLTMHEVNNKIATVDFDIYSRYFSVKILLLVIIIIINFTTYNYTSLATNSNTMLIKAKELFIPIASF